MVVMLSFLSCTLSLMAAASRLMYSYARDDMIFGSHLLRHFDRSATSRRTPWSSPRRSLP